MSLETAEWWDLFEVRMAERLAGGDPAEFVQTLINIIDSGIVNSLKAELKQRGLTIEAVMDMRSQVACAEAEAADPTYDHPRDQLTLTSTSRQCIKRLFLAQFDGPQIADLLDVDQAKVDACLKQDQMDDQCRTMAKLHLAGHSSSAIAEKLNTSRQRVERRIRLLGHEPNKENTRIGAAEREKILKLRAEGEGYTAIARAVGVDYYAVRYVCRKAAEARQNELTRVDL